MADGATKHLLLNGAAGWQNALLTGLVTANDGAILRLQALPGSSHPLADASGSFGGLVCPQGLAIDCKGIIYVLDAHGPAVKRFDPCGERFETLPCIGGAGSKPRQLANPNGLAVTRAGDLYITDSGNRRVQVFATKGLALRTILGPFKVVRQGSGVAAVEQTYATYPAAPAAGTECRSDAVFAEGTWEPWDIAISHQQRIFISDRANGLVHVFDFCGDWQRAYDGAADGVAPLETPTRIAVDCKGRLYVIQEEKDFVTILDANGKYLGKAESPEDLKTRFCPVSVAVDDDGNLCVSEACTSRVFQYCVPATVSDPCLRPVASFPGYASALVFDPGGNALQIDPCHPRVCRYDAGGSFAAKGLYYSQPLDSRTYRCQWHKVKLSACVREGTTIRVDTLTADSPKTLGEVLTLPAERWSTAQTDATPGQGEWDCLIRSLPGRYLWLRLTVTGDGHSTPEIQAIKVYFPRSSSLKYLPATYSEEPISRDFLDRFLSIFDTIRGGTWRQLTDIALYFDPGATPEGTPGPAGHDFLTWLASWIGLTLERHWPIQKRRRLLKEAHRLYALRGTPEGLRLHLRLYTGSDPRILELFKLRRWLFLNKARLGDQSALWGNDIVERLQLNVHSQIGGFQLVDSGDPIHDPFYANAHQFIVFVPADEPMSATQKQTIERIIEMAKPAHTMGELRLVQPRFRVGLQSFVGVDTVVGRYPSGVVEGNSKLGYDSVLGSSREEAGPPATRVGKNSRIGSSTLID